MDFNEYLEKEYKKQNKTPVYCNFGDVQLVVPVLYNGDKSAFWADLLDEKDEWKKYQENKCNKFEWKEEGEASILVPYEVKDKSEKDKVKAIKKIKKSAIRKYKNAVQNTIRANRENQKAHYLTSMKTEDIEKLKEEHLKYLVLTSVKKHLAHLKA